MNMNESATSENAPSLEDLEFLRKHMLASELGEKYGMTGVEITYDPVSREIMITGIYGEQKVTRGIEEKKWRPFVERLKQTHTSGAI